MSQISLRIDGYFGSATAAAAVCEAFELSRRERSEATVKALSELGFEKSEVVRDWFNVLFERRSRQVTLLFDAPTSSDEEWEAPLIDFLTRQGATHVLIDHLHLRLRRALRRDQLLRRLLAVGDLEVMTVTGRRPERLRAPTGVFSR